MRRRITFWFLLVLPLNAWGVGSLESVLIHPSDLPTSCQPVAGFFPLNEKIDRFYQYKAYASALAPVVDRHAQSFDCSGQKGTLYFFAYARADQAESAERFAKPVLSQSSASPLFREWQKGFVVISFPNSPPELLAVLDRKISSTSGGPIAAPARGLAAPTVSINAPAAIPRPVVVAPPVAESKPPPPPTAVLAASLPVPIAPPPPVPVSLAPRAPVVETAVPDLPDLADKFLKTLAAKVQCGVSGLSPDLKDVCAWMKDFQHGVRLVPVIAATQPKIGLAYAIDSDGNVARSHYEAALGSGKPGEIKFVPLILASGVEEFEAQALIEARQKDRLWPSNEVSAEIAKHSPPTTVSLVPTTGRSWVLTTPSGRRLYLRGFERAWILVDMPSPSPDGFTPPHTGIGILY